VPPNISTPITFLAALTGAWQGQGINHESQPYQARLTFDPPINPSALSVHFTATGEDGAIYHAETLLIGAAAAYSASTNLPGIAHFAVTHPTPDAIHLTLGDLTNQNSFREVITLRLDASGTLLHNFAWAMPNDPIQNKSTAHLRQVS
jgi:hypothetical protein